MKDKRGLPGESVMNAGFSHERLDVYQRALVFYGTAAEMARSWDSQHSVVDHFSRASEGIVECIAAASASASGAKLLSLDYALESTLECAACLDIAPLKGLIAADRSTTSKRALAGMAQA